MRSSCAFHRLSRTLESSPSLMALSFRRFSIFSSSAEASVFSTAAAAVCVSATLLDPDASVVLLPLTQLLFLDEAKLIGAGHDANPALFSKQNAWAFSKFLDEKKEAETKASTGVAAKMAMWQAKDKTGSAAGASG